MKKRWFSSFIGEFWTWVWWILFWLQINPQTFMRSVIPCNKTALNLIVSIQLDTSESLSKRLLQYTHCAHSQLSVFVFQYVHSISGSPGELIKRGFWFPTVDPPSTTRAAVVGYNNTTAGLSNNVHTHKYLEG